MQHMLQVSHHQLQHNFLFYAYNKCSPKRQSELKSVGDTGGLQGFEVSPPDIFPCWLQEIVDSLLLLMELLNHFSLSPDFPINLTPYSSQTLLLLIMFIATSKTVVCKTKTPVSQPNHHVLAMKYRGKWNCERSANSSKEQKLYFNLQTTLASGWVT